MGNGLSRRVTITSVITSSITEMQSLSSQGCDNYIMMIPLPRIPISTPNALEHVMHLLSNTLTPELFLQLPHRMPKAKKSHTVHYIMCGSTFSVAFALQIGRAVSVSGCTKCGTETGVLEAAAVTRGTWINDQIGGS